MSAALLLFSACTPDVPITDSAEPETTPPDTDTDTTITVDGISVSLHDEVNTVLQVTWTEEADVDLSWIEYSFDGTALSTPQIPRAAGEHTAVLLGIGPQETVRLTVMRQLGEETTASKTITAQTGALPSKLPAPTLESYDPALASPEGWVLISVDSSEPEQWYSGPYFVIILDRQARVVWYHEVPDRRVAMFPQVSYDGTHLIFDESVVYFSSASTSRLHRLSLDHTYDEHITVDRYVYGFTEVEDGAIIRDHATSGDFSLIEQDADGTTRTIWACNPWLEENIGSGTCYTNAVNYHPETRSILWSLPYHDTVLEIDRDSGEVLRVFGEHGATHTTSPSDALFDFQHYPRYTPDGTLIASMHIEGTTNQQRAREYAIDDEAGTLTEIWSYGAGIDEYAYYSGEAYRLANGNTLLNYGTGGAAREITPDHAVAWDIAFPDRHLTGHSTLIPDLYALLGPE